MARPRLRRALQSALVALTVALWCWVITANHAAWSFGVVEGYLEGGRIPLYPTIEVTYSEFFFFTITSPMITFILAFICCNFSPQRLVTAGIFICWVIGFLVGAENVSFTFQIDYGTTWGPGEALRALFFHPIVTPLALVFGWLGAMLFTRPLRR